MKKQLITLVSIPVFAFGLGGCREDFSKYKDKENFHIEASREANKRVLRIDEQVSAYTRFPVHLTAIDKDGKFDTIRVDGIIKDSKIPQYANNRSLNKLYREVKRTGIDYDADYNPLEKINPFLSPIPYIDNSTWDSMKKEQRDSTSRDYFKKNKQEKK